MPENQRGLDARTRALVHAAVSVATGDTEVLRERFIRARVAQVPPRWIDELLLQSLLNVGYALGLQAFGVWREVSPAPSAGLAEMGEPVLHEGWRKWAERGAVVCREVYGRTYHKLLLNLRALHPALEALVVVDAYGKLMARDGLDLVKKIVAEAPHHLGERGLLVVEVGHNRATGQRPGRPATRPGTGARPEPRRPIAGRASSCRSRASHTSASALVAQCRPSQAS